MDKSEVEDRRERLERRYGQIGISAVAAALQFAGENKTASSTTTVDNRERRSEQLG